MKQEWPFIIVRNHGTGNANREFLRCLFDAQKRYPGLVEEIWFAGSSLNGQEENRKLAEESLPFRETCRELGIRFSFQQGCTLNHAPDGKRREDLFSDHAWAVDSNGKRCYGLFCANSEEARNYTRETAELLMTLLRPDSYWPDDDLRLFSKAPKAEVCFCEHCLEKFNVRYHHAFTREILTEQLFGKTPSAEVRREWTAFNGESLGGFAAVFREAADHVLPECRLGIQTVYSDWQYDGPDYRPIMEALAGQKRNEIGVRPGAGFYEESHPRVMLSKTLSAGEEAARCRKYGFVGQICYEAENFPHVSMEKNPECQMIECLLALASGMDSLALYWGADGNGESDENYAFYFDLLARYKPSFQAIRDAFRGTHQTGGSVFHGGNTLAEAEWKGLEDPAELFLMTHSIPVVRKSSESEFYILTERAVRELSEQDLPSVFGKAVLMDTEAFRKLKERFPSLDFTGKIRLQDHADRDLIHEVRQEMLEDGRRAGCFQCLLRAESPDVRCFSQVPDVPGAAGICTIPTEFGGSVVLVQYLNSWIPWTGYRRKAILDALDSVISGKTSVRLLTGGFAIRVIARKDDSTGRISGVFLLNAAIGSTPELKLAIRHSACREYQLFRPAEAPVVLRQERDGEDGVILTLPPFAAWQPAWITGKE